MNLLEYAFSWFQLNVSTISDCVHGLICAQELPLFILEPEVSWAFSWGFKICTIMNQFNPE